MNATYKIANRVRPGIDSARGHVDTSVCYMIDAVECLHGARKTRAIEILDKLSSVLADLDRLRSAL